MKRVLLVVAAVGLFGASAAGAAERRVKLDVANTTCALCGPIVKGALTRVAGVLSVSVVEREGGATATVRFDDSRTDVTALITATTNAGYPARVIP